MNPKINPSALYWASFNRFELRVSGQAVIDICHSGPNDAAVSAHLPLFRTQIELDRFRNRPTSDNVRDELREYGAWEDNELQCDTVNLSRLLWLAAWQIFESDEPDCSAPVAV